VSTPAIALRHVTKVYGERAVVDDVSFEVAEGELLVLLGGSGSGKTTTMKMINRLVDPTSGEIEIAGEPHDAVPAHELRRRIGYVFQRIGLFPHMSVLENVGVTPRLLGWEPARIRDRARELLAAMALDPDEVGDRRPHELSGGQRQRVGVARALAVEPKVVLFDEPFGALDPGTRDALQDLVRGLKGRFSGVFVTHDVPEALELGDRIAVLHEGQLRQIGTPAEVMRAPADPEVAAIFEAPERHAREMVALFDRDTV